MKYISRAANKYDFYTVEHPTIPGEKKVCLWNYWDRTPASQNTDPAKTIIGPAVWDVKFRPTGGTYKNNPVCSVVDPITNEELQTIHIGTRAFLKIINLTLTGSKHVCITPDGYFLADLTGAAFSKWQLVK